MTTDPPAFSRADWELPSSDRDLTRPESAAERITAMAARVEPGQRLGTKEELRALCGVSVGTFNEALRMAQARGVVSVRRGPGGGLFASRQSPMVRLGNSVLALNEDPALVAEAMRLRDALDPLLIEDALQHATDVDITAAYGILDRMRVAAENGDPTEFVRANWALHARIAATSPSLMLRSLYLNLLEMIESHTLEVITLADHPKPDDIHSRYQLHADLVDALAQRSSRALDIIREHNTSSALTVPRAAGWRSPTERASSRKYHGEYGGRP
jgi:DNA-binding FadR family transcriptional regulator